MPLDISGALRQALTKLEAEKGRIDRQIAGLRQALAAAGNNSHSQAPSATTRVRRGRKRMSAEERRQVSRRMKAFWAKRRRSKQGKEQ